MDQYPPGEYVSRARQTLLAPGPDQPLRTVEIDCGPGGAYRITFIAKQNPRRGMRNWFWTMHRGERIELGQPAPDGAVVDFVVVQRRMLARRRSRRYRPRDLSRNWSGP